MEALTKRLFGPLGLLLALLGVLVLIEATGYGVKFTVRAYEDLMLARAQSVERATAYGSRHLDYAHPLLYDIKAAEHFYREAARLDPAYPYVHHQLARIAFLRGNFPLALAEINTEIKLHGEKEPNTYYIRALIEGFRGDYAAAAYDYERFLKAHPNNWAALNDLAWVLLKSGKYAKARDAALRGLEHFPENAWLLNSLAIAQYELVAYDEAYDTAQKASVAVAVVSEAEWSRAYPGNDPTIAGAGLAAFKEAVENNINTIRNAVAAQEI